MLKMAMCGSSYGRASLISSVLSDGVEEHLIQRMPRREFPIPLITIIAEYPK
jgi:hypothetical protein